MGAVARLASILLCAWSGTATAAPQALEWTGQGSLRLLVRVGPVVLDGRERDESVAVYELDFDKLLDERSAAGVVDLSTLQVHRYDTTTGRAIRFGARTDPKRPFDHPCRFDDELASSDYRSRVGRASNYPNGRPPITVRRGKARLFNREHDSRSGRIVWVHTQESNEPSHYAIYFDVRTRSTATGPAPAPWIGDVDVLRRRRGQSLGGLAHLTTAVGDFDGDGLFDLIAGAEKGDLMWFPNRGEVGKPRFIGCRLLFDADGPLDTGWYGAPFLFDWDADGLPDLLVGTSGNVIVWWRNVGQRRAPALEYRGFVSADGGRLEVPESPVAEDATGIFARDYYNQPWVGDWDGDGLPDILTGGYTTGHVFYYRAIRRDALGVPVLKYVGPIQADGMPLDTTWAASPLAGDFNGDGKLELLTGSWWWSGISRKPDPGEADYLMYYRNSSPSEIPSLQRTAFPQLGRFPRGVIARPSAVDWNDDGLIDLVVSDNGGNIYRFLNVGTSTEPKWDMNAEPLTAPWGFLRGYGLATSAADLDGDGNVETISASTLQRIVGSPHAPRVEPCGQALVGGRPIEHAGPGYGDPYAFSILSDWDGDGRADILWATHQGNVFLHRHLGGTDPFEFAPGVTLRLVNGAELQLGPRAVADASEAADFTILQGSRLKLATADVDVDGIVDLIATETFANVWVFRNTRAGGSDTLAPGVNVYKLASRTAAINTIDWNRDGKPDLITGGSASRPGAVLLNRSEVGEPAFGAPIQPLDLPYVFWGPRFQAVDWNRDGDEDLLIQSEFYSFWAERSFIDHGYRIARVIGDGTLEVRRKGL